MIYLSGKLSPRLVENPALGQMVTRSSYRRAAFVGALPYGVDTGCFRHPERFRLTDYLAWLNEMGAEYGPSLFATAPDRFGDAEATLRVALPALGLIREFGHPAALVAQPTTTAEAVPWSEIDCLFVGGPDAWQRSDTCLELVGHARRRGKWTHKGRVNTFRRLIEARRGGFDSCDGTLLAFGFDVNFPALTQWLEQVNLQAPLTNSEVTV